jgi:polysaccharide deacetylase family protein (PEP-CTERM system associated)
MKNAITVDLEDYMHVTAFSQQITAEQWGSYASRLEYTAEKLLEILEVSRCRGTFFVLGWVAEKYPQVVRRIADSGHEIACHSLRHRLVYQMTPAEFREDTHTVKCLLESVSGKSVSGYRAPSFSITRETPWAFEILGELGFTYDSSIFPVNHPGYGLVEASRSPFLIKTLSGHLVEFPLPTLEFAGRRAPLGGGAYLRLLPYAYTKWGVSHLNRQEGRPVCVYLHPWELDANQPRMRGKLTSRLRHYLGLRGTESKLRKLLRDFEFCPLGELIAALEKDGLPDHSKLFMSPNGGNH